MDEPWARVERGWVVIGTDCDCRDADTMTPEAARTHAAWLLAAADECDRQREAILAACADGHDWGELHNGWNHWPDTKVCTHYCRREGCDGREELPGWVQFAGRLHFDPVSGHRVECYGPGCDPCDMEKLGTVLRGALSDAMAELDRAVLGSAFQRSVDG
jgi:hypothetical protein